MGDFTMPSLGADMEAGTVTKWLVAPGDEVHRGDIVAEVDTEKSTIEVEIFENGVIEELVVPEGERVPVGTVLAHVAARAPAHVGAAAPAPPPEVPAPPPPTGAPVYSPVIRHLAAELGVDLTAVEGSGPGGTVTRDDVERAAAAARRRPRRARKTRTRAAPRTTPAPGGRPGPATPAGAPVPPGRAAPSSPLARRLAAELGVELAGLAGTGPHGSVVERDVRLAARAVTAGPTAPVRAAPAPAAPFAGGPSAQGPPVVGEDRQTMLRRAIGGLMARSKREIPHYYLSTTIELGAATEWLERQNLERPVTDRLVLPVLLLKATARAVAKVPEVNGFFVDGGFVPSEAVHVGVAVSLRSGGVMAPAIHDTDRLTVDELMVQLRDLVGRARRGVLRSSEMSDPTITVTNLGDLGVEAVFGVIYPPQVALVGFGRVTERPYAHGGMIGVRPCVTATLSADHRVSDGHRGARFLAEIDRLLQEPDEL